ncbi:MAG: winged helix-turn-helix transcriptional regulator [Candidatus Hermodarchaeota archaeon]
MEKFEMSNVKLHFSKIRRRYLLILLPSLIVLVISSVALFLFVMQSQSFGSSLIRYGSHSIFIVIFTLIIVLSFFISILAIMTFQEYRALYLQKNSETKRKDRLSLYDVFENRNRKIILVEILNEQGIHYNELLRRTKLSPGQLQWHLNVLLEFEIIQKQKVDHYLVFFTVFADESEKKEHMLSIRSKNALKIFSLIENHPGTNPSAIARQLNMRRNSVKYNIDKLLDKNLIYSTRLGRQILLYPAQNAT